MKAWLLQAVRAAATAAAATARSSSMRSIHPNVLEHQLRDIVHASTTGGPDNPVKIEGMP